jgi:tetratricopeptide (TPR) repeat protein
VDSVLMRPHLQRLFAAAMLSCAAYSAVPFASGAESPSPGASTVIGANAMLSDGAQALMSGEWERGVQLTQLGLNETISASDRAAAHANLCAGYTALKKYERALENCNQSIALLDDNWRAWQNRAAALLGLGKIEEAIRDIERGLQLNPDSEDLQKTLAIAREYEKLQQERMRRLVES